jgi:hypothetical protein
MKEIGVTSKDCVAWRLKTHVSNAPLICAILEVNPGSL